MAVAAEGLCQCATQVERRKKADVHPKIKPVDVPPPGTKVCFLGDAGSTDDQRKVLELVKSEGAEFVVHGGDFEYKDDAALFEEHLDAVLGADYPYFADIGNHDVKAWTGQSGGGHKERLEARLKRFGGADHCAGEYGVNMVCNYKGLTFVLSGVGTQGSNHVDYINRAFDANPTRWRMCNWHKNQRLMQVGGKSDEVGWGAYEACREQGAIIATHHEHSWCRSKNLKKTGPTPEVANEETKVMTTFPGETFVFVSGLAGKGIRVYQKDREKNPWWASTGAEDDNVDFGAVFCVFNVDNDPSKANCEFKQVNGKVWDSWTIQTRNGENLNRTVSSPAKTDMILDLPALADHPIDAKNLTTPTLTLSQGAHFRFSAAGLTGKKVQQAMLQFYGAEEDKTYSDLQICGVRSQRCVTWQGDKEGSTELGEKHEVWVSPDLTPVVEEEVKAGNGFVELRITGAHPSAYPVFTGDYSPCLAPHLWTELAN